MPFAHIYRSVMAPKTNKRKESPPAEREGKKAKTDPETQLSEGSTAASSNDTTTNIAAGQTVTVPPADVSNVPEPPPADVSNVPEPPSDVLSLPDGDRHFYSPFYMDEHESFIPYQNEAGEWLKGTEGPYNLTHLYGVKEDMARLGVNYDSSQKMRITFDGEQGEHKVFPLWLNYDLHFHKFGVPRQGKYVDMCFHTADRNFDKAERPLKKELKALEEHLLHHVEVLQEEKRQMIYPIFSAPPGQDRHSLRLSLTLQGSDQQCPMVFNCEGGDDTLVQRDAGLTPEATMKWYEGLLANKKLRVLMKIAEVRANTQNRNQVSISAYVGKIEILGDFRPHGNTGKSTPRAVLTRRRR